ncbi:hypothetical protein CDL15_Pgr015849 [Punica granatum]|uniref:Enhancer of rudimentary homolog n=1 Tax=Punica granatum TaxID=22663 RepID=A0A218XPD1_PUNGR|nr:hypothetical protein CDL15_Pgr015849 [Punica granatum]
MVSKLTARSPDGLAFNLSGCPFAIFDFTSVANGRALAPRPRVNKHTIVLMQPSPNRASRTFMDYESVSQAIDGICGLYERKLKELNPAIRNITYDISDLYNFIDGLADLSALVYTVLQFRLICPTTGSGSKAAHINT